MKIAILTITFIGLAQCAKLDHLKYLPPDSRPTNKETFDQGLAAPTTGQAQESFGSVPQSQQRSFGQSTSFAPQPTASGSFNAGSQNAANLQGAPFIPHGSQGSSGTYGSPTQSPQLNQPFSAGQQFPNEPKGTGRPSDSPGTFGSQRFNQPQGYQGAGAQKPTPFGGIQSTQPQRPNNFQGSTTFGNTVDSSQVGTQAQPESQPQGSSNAPDSQPRPDSDAQSAKPYNSDYSQGSTYEKSSPSSTFPGATGSAPSFTHGSSFAKNGPAVNNFKSQTTSTFGAGVQPSRNYGPSAGVGKSVSPIGAYPNAPQPSQAYGPAEGQQGSQSGVGKSVSPIGAYPNAPQPSQTYGPAEGQQGSESGVGKSVSPIGAYPNAPQPSQTYGPTEQDSQSIGNIGSSTDSFKSSGPGKSGLFNNGPSVPTQSKYQSSSLNQIPIIRLDTKNYGDGSYSTAYETGNGIQAEEQGQTQGDNTIAQGSFSYTSPQGEKVGLTYTADEDGYHPQGEHLPTPPPVPEAILKSIEYNQAHPEEENDDGSYREPDSSESDGQYKSPFSKSQYSGSSNKYLAPTSSPPAKNQFSGNSFSPLTRGSSTAGSNSFPSNAPSSNQATFPSSGFISSSVGGQTQDQSGSPVSPSLPSSEGHSPQSSSDRLPSQASGNQYGAPSFGSGSNTPTTGSNKAFPSSSFGNSGSKTDQSNSGLPSQSSSFNSPASAAPGFKSAGFFNKGFNAPLDSSSPQFDSQDSVVIESSSPQGDNPRGYASGGSPNINAPQTLPSGQFSSYQSSTGPSSQPSGQYGSSSKPSYPGAPAGSSNFNAPQKIPSGQFSSNQFSSGSSNQPTGQYGSSLKPSYPGAPAGSSNFNAQQKIPSGQFSSNQFSSGSSNQPTGQYGSSTKPSYPGAPQNDVSSQSTYQNTNNGPAKAPNAQQGSGNTGFGANTENKQTFGQFPGSQSQQNVQATFSAGPSAPVSTQFSGYQYNKPNASFGKPGTSSFQQGDLSKPNSSPFGNTQIQSGLPSGKFGSNSGPSKGVGEFGSGEFRGPAGSVRTPGVQAQDENGGYLY